MNRKKRIHSILLNNFIEWDIEVVDNSSHHIGHNNFDGSGETHFQLTLFNKTKTIINRVDLHRKINTLLKDEFLNGLHALEIKSIN